MQNSTTMPQGTSKGSKVTAHDNSSANEGESIRVPLAMTFEELLGEDDGPHETADEMINAVRQWRDMPSGRKSH